MIVKRFIFEAIDCYLAPAYLAFFQGDVLHLRAELVRQGQRRGRVSSS